MLGSESHSAQRLKRRRPSWNGNHPEFPDSCAHDVFRTRRHAGTAPAMGLAMPIDELLALIQALDDAEERALASGLVLALLELAFDEGGVADGLPAG